MGHALPRRHAKLLSSWFSLTPLRKHVDHRPAQPEPRYPGARLWWLLYSLRWRLTAGSHSQAHRRRLAAVAEGSVTAAVTTTKLCNPYVFSTGAGESWGKWPGGAAATASRLAPSSSTSDPASSPGRCSRVVPFAPTTTTSWQARPAPRPASTSFRNVLTFSSSQRRLRGGRQRSQQLRLLSVHVTACDISGRHHERRSDCSHRQLFLQRRGAHLHGVHLRSALHAHGQQRRQPGDIDAADRRFFRLGGRGRRSAKGGEVAVDH